MRASGEEIKERGGKLVMLSQWKMKDFGPASDMPRFADFVIYATPSSGETAIEAIGKAVKELADVLKDFDLPEPSELPRYSIPVLVNGKEFDGLSICQGNGDFKDYLVRTEGQGN